MVGNAELNAAVDTLLDAYEVWPGRIALIGVAIAVVILFILMVCVDKIGDGIDALVARWRRWQIARLLRAGGSRYADPGRLHRETAGEVDRLARAPRAPRPGATCVVNPRGLELEEALPHHMLARSDEGAADAGAGGEGVRDVAQGPGGRLDAGYGETTRLVAFPGASQRLTRASAFRGRDYGA